MNANAQKWVDALRSGEYSQARGRLKDRCGNYCCLGVACELYRQEVGGAWNCEHDFRPSKRGMPVQGSLPSRVRNWLNLNENDGATAVGNSLAVLNDNGASFAEIADVIESEPEGLFRPNTNAVRTADR